MYMLPAIDILEGRAVRLAKGDYEQVSVYNEDPLDQARIFEETGATWLHVVDLDGAKSGYPDNIDMIERIVRNTSLNVEVGGGIRTPDTLDRLFDVGIARAVLGTALVRDPDFARAALDRYGDALAAGIDSKSGEVAVQGWCEGAGITTEDLVKKVSDMGYAHLIYTDISRDGMQTGIDAAAYAHIAQVFGHRVVASGGVASISDIQCLCEVADCIEGIIVGRAIYEGTLSLSEGIAACNMASAAKE